MRYTPIVMMLALCLGVVLAGCGGRKEEPKPATEAPAPAAPDAGTEEMEAAEAGKEMETEMPEGAEDADTGGDMETDEAEDDGGEAMEEEAPNELVGTKWNVGEYEVEFKNNTTVLVKGGQINDLAPEGVEGAYTLEDGRIEVEVLGETRVGTWDGEKLVVDGAEGTKIE